MAEETKSAAEMAKEGNLMIGAGAGVGALGVGAALISGAVCPLCYIVPPVLIATGAWRKKCAKSASSKEMPKPEVK